MIRFRDLNVDVVENATDDIRRHIARIILGTPGGILYRQVGSVEKLNEVGRIFFMTLRKGIRLLGMVGFVHRLVHNGDRRFISLNIRYFSIFAPLRLKNRKAKFSGREKKIDSKDAPLLKQSFIKRKLIDIFDHLHDLAKPGSNEKLKILSVAYVAKENIRSMDFSSLMGYQTVREFITLEFSRFFPKQNKLVSRILPEEKTDLKGKLKLLYKDHTLYFTDNTFYKDQYFVLRKDGEILAGVQANPVEWEILEMPGKVGGFIMNVVPRIPFVSSLFHPESFRFAAFEAVWYKSGYEELLPVLFESACAMLNVNVGLAWFDSECPVLKDIKSVGELGFLGKIIGSQPADVRFRFYNFSEEEKLEFYNKPAYISSFDVT